MAKELSDWIAPWVDNHYTRHGTDLGREYQDGKRIQIIRFETWRDRNNSQDKKQIIALGTDKVHCVRLVFDSDATDRYCEQRGPGKPMTADLRSIYRLKNYRLSLPLLKSTRSPFLEIYVKDWEWWCGATSEIQFCEDPIDMKIPLEMDEPARVHRDWKESRDRDHSEDRVTGAGMTGGEIDVYEQFRQGGMGKTTEAVRKDAWAALAILWQAHRGVPQAETVQVAPALVNDASASANVVIRPDAHVDQDPNQHQDQDQIDPGMDVDDDDEESPPNKNSYEAPPFQIPPNPSLSHPDPTPTPSPPSSSPDPIVEKLRAGGSTPMELYELLVKRQLEGKNVDWAFRPARSLGGEAGLTKILDGITVFGLNLDEELDDSDEEAEIERPVAATRRSHSPTKEVAGSSRAGRMMKMRPALSDEDDEDADGDGDEGDDGVETEVISEESSDDDQDQNQTQDADKVGHQDEVEGEDATTIIATTPATSTLPKRERSPTYEWSLSPPEPKKVTNETELAPEGEIRQVGPLPETTTVAAAEEVDDMLMIPPNKSPERVPIEEEQPDHAKTQIAASLKLPIDPATERRSTTPAQNDLPDPPRTTALTPPKRRPNVKRIRLDTPSSDEGEPLPSVLGKRKASLSSTPPAEGSERESKRLQKIKKLKLLEEQMKKIQASIDVDDEEEVVEEDPVDVEGPSQVPEEPDTRQTEVTTEDLPTSGLGTLAVKEAVPLPLTSDSANKHDIHYNSPPGNANVPSAVPELPQRPLLNQPVRHEGLNVDEVIAIGKEFRAFLQQARR